MKHPAKTRRDIVDWLTGHRYGQELLDDAVTGALTRSDALEVAVSFGAKPSDLHRAIDAALAASIAIADLIDGASNLED